MNLKAEIHEQMRDSISCGSLDLTQVTSHPKSFKVKKIMEESLVQLIWFLHGLQ